MRAGGVRHWLRRQTVVQLVPLGLVKAASFEAPREDLCRQCFTTANAAEFLPSKIANVQSAASNEAEMLAFVT